MSQLLEQIEVLHVARAHLDDIDIRKQRQLGDVHNFGYDGHARGLLGLQQQPDALGAHALESIGGSARLEGAAPQQPGAGSLHRLCHLDDLFLAFNRAGPGDELEIAPTDFRPADIQNGIIRMEIPVDVLIGLPDALDVLHNFQALDEVQVDFGSIAHKAKDGLVFALAHMRIQPEAMQPGDEVLLLLLIWVAFEDDDHGFSAPSNRNMKLFGKIKNAAAFRTLHLLSDDSAALKNLEPWQ